MLDTGYGGAMETGDGWDDTGFMATEPGGQMVASETAQGQWEWDGAEWVWAEGSASYPADANAYGSPEYGDWASHEDDDGNQYWYNAVTGETQWEPPPSTTAVDGAVLQYAAAADGAAAAAAYGAHDDGAYDETQWDYDPAAGAYDEGGGLPTTAAAGAGDDGADGDPWLEMRDDDGNLYYYNHVSGEAAWERPAAAGAAGVPPLPLEAAGQEQQQPAAAADGVSELAPPLDAEALEAQALMASATKRQKRKSHVKPSQASAAAAAAADRAPPPLGQVDLKLAGKASKVDMGERQWDVRAGRRRRCLPPARQRPTPAHHPPPSSGHRPLRHARAQRVRGSVQGRGREGPRYEKVQSAVGGARGQDRGGDAARARQAHGPAGRQGHAQPQQVRVQRAADRRGRGAGNQPRGRARGGRDFQARARSVGVGAVAPDAHAAQRAVLVRAATLPRAPLCAPHPLYPPPSPGTTSTPRPPRGRSRRACGKQS